VEKKYILPNEHAELIADRIKHVVFVNPATPNADHILAAVDKPDTSVNGARSSIKVGNLTAEAIDGTAQGSFLSKTSRRESSSCRRSKSGHYCYHIPGRKFYQLTRWMNLNTVNVRRTPRRRNSCLVGRQEHAALRGSSGNLSVGRACRPISLPLNG
jgi:hypothetical protein